MKTTIGLRKFSYYKVVKVYSSLLLISGRDDFNRDYNYNSGSFTMNEKNEINSNQNSHEEGEEDDEYNSDDEEVNR